MSDEALTWPEAFGRVLAVGPRTATGTIRYRLPGEERGTLRFWYGVPDRWRVEDERGVWHVADGRRQLVRQTDGVVDLSGVTIGFGQRHPTTLFGVRRGGAVEFDWLRDFPHPDGVGAPVEVAGRRAWEFALSAVEHKRARKPYPLRVAVDKATGIVLRLAIPEADHLVELTGLTVDADPPADVYLGRPRVHPVRRGTRRARTRPRWLARTPLPVPRWWPRGVAYHGGDGDPATGAYRVLLETPDLPELSRWPAGTPMPPGWDRGHGQRHVHRWRDERWEWALAVSEPLTGEELARVIESIPQT